MLKDPFNSAIGEQILSSFSYDEGTYPATALLKTSEKVWQDTPTEKLAPTTHRFVIMLTDCLTEERKVEDWKSTVNDFKFNLSVLLLKDHKYSGDFNFLETVAPGSSIVLDTTESDKMSVALCDLMTKQFNKVIAKIESTSTARGDAILTPTVPSFNQNSVEFLDVGSTIGSTDFHTAIRKGSGGQQQQMYYASAPDATIPFADKLLQTKQQQQPASSSPPPLEDTLRKLSRHYQDLARAKIPTIQDAEQSWAAAENKLTRQIDGKSFVIYPL